MVSSESKPCGRLVEENHPGFGGEGAGEPGPLYHATGQLRRVLVEGLLLEAYHLELEPPELCGK